MAVLPGERRLLRRRGEAAAAAVAQVRGSEEFGDGFRLGYLDFVFIGIFLTSSAREASAPCDADRTEAGIVAIADA
jgi:hypothetical protein